MPGIYAHGVPAPQGSKRAYVNRATGRASLVEMSRKVGPWRAAVRAAWEDAGHGTVPGPVEVALEFHLPRPKSHYGTGRNAGTVRPRYADAPHVSTPDLDKLVRSTMDALTQAAAFEDDSRAVRVEAVKRYAQDAPGALVVVEPARAPEAVE